ncbi:hypothetical protein D9C73_010134 [Collichthys lucidus]|uniref:Uncharacterized protein n=1 Tax=Collichthys lucidus TaxID=240159 RepID=A0A4U5UQ63_COLLU|nr:hypothetical protein D9C73_010134 [Collichthys lucidus]
MITMRRRRQQQRQQRFARRPHDTLRLRERKNKRHDPLLCKCLVAMGMYHLVDRFDNFNRFIRMSSAQCRLYGPKFVVNTMTDTRSCGECVRPVARTIVNLLQDQLKEEVRRAALRLMNKEKLMEWIKLNMCDQCLCKKDQLDGLLNTVKNTEEPGLMQLSSCRHVV